MISSLRKYYVVCLCVCARRGSRGKLKPLLRSSEESEPGEYKCRWMLQKLTLLMSCDSGAGGSSWCYNRGVPSSPSEPQLECPESCALP